LAEAEVRELAEEIDVRMRNIASQANTPDSLRVAILTALHLAQEYRELQRNCEQKTDEWSRALEQVLRK
jgi:cell division protein ZapA (FtsZ GTPase activity inhibitor)